MLRFLVEFWIEIGRFKILSLIIQLNRFQLIKFYAKIIFINYMLGNPNISLI